ncbi:MAG: hypothetical protein A2Y02_03390 [Omnitrophica bacterium GWA2_52_12]|nr:MAG: hypothetical protein A2Y02_03390 [Omnitrophica bacterium GWA2_52_12]
MEISSSEISERVKKILTKVLKVPAEEMTPDSLIMADLGADSVEIWDIAVGIEKEFKIKLQQNNIENIKTIKNILELVDLLLSKKA